LPQLSTGDDADAAWVEFLLEGEDGRHAGELFDFINQAVEASARQPLPTTAVGPGDAYLNREGDAGWRPESVLSNDRSSGTESGIESGTVARRQFHRWLADPLVGQPILRWPEDENVSPEEARIAHEMVVALKLIERYGQRETSSIQPVVVYGRGRDVATTVRPAINEFGVASVKLNRNAAGGAKGADLVIATARAHEARPPVNLARLADRLGDPLSPSWATIDAGGELLLWTDRGRVGELTTRLANDYQIVRREAGYRLVGRTPSGRAIEVWLEANRDQPRRPLARVELSRP